MIEPTQDDLGRAVVYRPAHWPKGPVEHGVITSFTKDVVFVRYADQPNSKATMKKDLTWLEDFKVEDDGP